MTGQASSDRAKRGFRKVGTSCIGMLGPPRNIPEGAFILLSIDSFVVPI
jgi:hypothetical protein